MTKIMKNTSIILFTFLLTIFLTNSSLIIKSVNVSLDLFINKLVPSLFPFFILSDILNNYNYLYYLSKLFKFKYSDVIILSLFSGLPSNAKYILALLKDKKISIKDASILLSTTFFPNPIFVLTTIGLLIFNNRVIGIKILFIVYLSNLILYLFYYKRLGTNYISIKSNSKPFFYILKSSTLNNIETMMVILGTLIVFNSINSIINEYLITNKIISTIINLLLEMTSGINKLSSLNINNSLKYTLCTITLTFSSLSILFQAFSILEEYDINKKLVFKNKIILVIISLILSILVF